MTRRALFILLLVVHSPVARAAGLASDAGLRPARPTGILPVATDGIPPARGVSGPGPSTAAGERRAGGTPAPPVGDGLAKGFPGDRGIDSAPQVLFADDFELGGLAGVVNRWTEVSNKDARVVSLVPGGPVAASRQCLQLTAHPGRDTGGHLYKRLSREVDRYHVRFYVKFSGDPSAYIHHFVHLGGYRPATDWPQGGAGDRPSGDDRITVGIEPFGMDGRQQAPGLWNFYAYWHEMQKSADGRFWGNAIGPQPPLAVPRERWQCVEVMVALNSKPEAADGLLRLWLDGREVMDVRQGTLRGQWSGMGFNLPATGGEPFEGFRFRTDDRLKLNFVWLLHYVTDTALKRNGVDRFPAAVPVWFDDVVAATEYIGPIAEK